MKTNKLISPIEIKNMTSDFDSIVDEVINNLIIANWNGYHSQFTHKEAIEELKKHISMPLLAKTVIYNNENRIIDNYSANGWVVKDVSPESYQSFESYFEFEPKK